MENGVYLNTEKQQKRAMRALVKHTDIQKV